MTDCPSFCLNGPIHRLTTDPPHGRPPRRYQLNTEKLEYNYRVLTERDMENTQTLMTQKRRLNRLKDTLSTLMSKYEDSNKKYKAKNAELTDEYTRATKQCVAVAGGRCCFR